MSSVGVEKKHGLTEYSVLVCVLFFKVWCWFANQALLFAAGAGISGIIDFAICAYICLNAKRVNGDRNKNRVTNNFLLMFLTFAVVYMLIFFLGREELHPTMFLGMIPMYKQISNMLFLIIYLTGLMLTVKNLHEEERKLVSDFIIWVFFAVALANLIAVIVNPELAKNESYNEGTSIFTLGYSGSYPMVFLTPILLYKLGEEKNKLLFGAVLTIHLVSIFYGGYFIAILGTIVAILMYLILGIKNKIVVLVFAVLLMAAGVAFVLSGMLEEMMWYLADNINIEVISDRCRDIAEYVSGDTDVTEADTTFRITIYQNGLDEFLKRPIFGNFIFGNYKCQWDHSTIIDLLAVGGIFLCGLFAVVLSFGYNFVCAFLSGSRAKRAFIAAIVAFLFVAVLNPVLSSYRGLGVLFAAAPIIMGGADKHENTDTPSL